MQPISLTTLTEQQLDAARQATSGRSAHTIRGGRRLALHQSPGEATLQILRGRVRLATAEEAWEAAAGDYLDIPPQRHTLSAIEDSVVLLTVITQTAGSAGP